MFFDFLLEQANKGSYQVDTEMFQLLSSLPVLLHVKQLRGTERFPIAGKKNGTMIDIAAEGFSHGFHLSFTCKQH